MSEVEQKTRPNWYDILKYCVNLRPNNDYLVRILDMKRLFALVAWMLLGLSVWAQETEVSKYDDGIASKFEFRFSLGAGFGTPKDLMGTVDLGVGYNLNSHWYLGVASGVYPMFGVVDGATASNVIPAMADLTWRSNGESERQSFFVQLRGGMLLNMRGEEDLEFGPENYKFQNYTAVEFGPGIYLRTRRNIDVRFSFNYALAMPGNDGEYTRNHQENIVMARVGMNFRGKPKTASRSELRVEAKRKAAEENLRLESERRAAREEAERQAEQRAREARELRRQQRENAARQSADIASSMYDKSKLQLFFYARENVAEGDPGVDDILSELARYVGDGRVTHVLVKGYPGKYSTGDANSVVMGLERAEKVQNLLVKKYGIDINRVSTILGDRTDVPDQGYDDVIAIVMVQMAEKTENTGE